MKNIKNVSKRIFAMLMVLAILLCGAVVVDGILNPAYADEDYSQYDFSLTGKLDPEFYMNTYPDIRASVGTDPYALWEHYADYGIYEGRIPYAGAQPGEPVGGYITVGINPDLAASATVVEQTDQTTATAADEYDLSDWTPEQLAAYAQKQIEFDASGLVHVGWTEEQVQAKLLSLKEVYPEGTVAGYCDEGAAKILGALYGADMDWVMGYKNAQGGMDLIPDKAGNRVMPVGYVEEEIYRRGSGQGNIRDIRVGDTLYTAGSGTGHVQVVLSHDDRGITVVESNQNSDKKMHWGRRISWEELENGGNTVYKAANKWAKITHHNY